MSEEKHSEVTTQENDRPDLTPKNIRGIRRTYIIALIFIGATIADSLVQYSDYGAWQILADAAGMFIGLLLLAASFVLFNRGKIHRAVSLIPIILFVAYAPGDLFLEGVTFYNLLSGVLLFALTFFIFRPSNPGYWLRVSAVYVTAVLIFSQLNIFDRFDISVSDSWAVSLPIFTAVITLLLVFQIITNLPIRTIRTRLILTFISIGLLPVIIISGTSSLFAYQQDRTQTRNTLNSVSNLKSVELNAWITQLNNDMNILLKNYEFVTNAEFLLDFTPTESVIESLRNELLQEMNSVVGTGNNFTEIFIVEINGEIITSTQPQNESRYFSNSTHFTSALSETISTPIKYNYLLNQTDIIIAQPLKNNWGDVFGVLVGRANPAKLTEIMSSTNQLGETGKVYLVNEDRILLTVPDNMQDYFVGSYIRGQLNLTVTDQESTSPLQTYTSLEGTPLVTTATYLPEVEAFMVVEQNQAEAIQTLSVNLLVNGTLAVLTLIAIVVTSYNTARRISLPIRKLSEDADKVWHREINTIEPIKSDDEIGELSLTLSKMTEELVQTTTNLEAVVSERTKILERRATYLQTTSEISKALTGIYNLENLLNTVTYLISENFGFYHVGIFMLDAQREYAELKAANSEGGWKMLARGHKLKVGEQGIVGFVTSTGQPRIQQQVAGEDSVYYNNPDLPLTRSEMALPLQAGNEIFGALDVQSTAEEAFSDEDVSALQVLADAVAIAIQNTRLVQQLQENLETERRFYGDFTSNTWRAKLDEMSTVPAFKSDRYGIQAAGDMNSELAQKAIQTGQTAARSAEKASGMHLLAVPIKVRGGATVAVIETQKPAAFGPWTNEEITILESVGIEMGMAIENARLFEETQRTAQKERISANLSAKIWSSTDVENILQTAVRELGSALNISYGTIQLKLPDESEQNGNQDGVEIQ